MISKIKVFRIAWRNRSQLWIRHKRLLIMTTNLLKLCNSLKYLEVFILSQLRRFCLGFTCSHNVIGGHVSGFFNHWIVNFLVESLSPFNRLQIWVVFDSSLVPSYQTCNLRACVVVILGLLTLQMIQFIQKQSSVTCSLKGMFKGVVADAFHFCASWGEWSLFVGSYLVERNCVLGVHVIGGIEWWPPLFKHLFHLTGSCNIAALIYAWWIV